MNKILIETFPHGSDPYRVLSIMDVTGKGAHHAIPHSATADEIAVALELLAGKLRGKGAGNVDHPA